MFQTATEKSTDLHRQTTINDTTDPSSPALLSIPSPHTLTHTRSLSLSLALSRSFPRHSISTPISLSHGLTSAGIPLLKKQGHPERVPPASLPYRPKGRKVGPESWCTNVITQPNPNRTRSPKDRKIENLLHVVSRSLLHEALQSSRTPLKIETLGLLNTPHDIYGKRGRINRGKRSHCSSHDAMTGYI